MRTLIVHPKDSTTDFLKPIYSSISNKTIITGGVTKSELRKLIEINDRVIMLGHGSPFGLMSVNQFPYAGANIIDETMATQLSKKTHNIYIWCFADKFVQRNRLNGFYSGMFISEFAEAFSWGFYISDRNLIKESNECFASVVSLNIHQPLEVLFDSVIQEYAIMAKTNPIAKFNMERLYLNSNNCQNGSNRFCTELRELP